MSVPSSLARNLRSTQRAPGPAGLLLADAPNRVVALLIDMMVLSLVGLVVTASLGAALGGVVTARTLETTGGELNVVPFLIVAILVLALSLAYCAISWTRWQASPGMRLLGLAVLDEGGRHPLSGRQAFVRWLLVGIPATLTTLPVYVPSVVAMLLGVLGAAALAGLLATIGQSPSRQGLHDRHAGSVVTTVSRRR